MQQINYIGEAITSQNSRADSVYGLYLDKCGQNFLNNWQVAVNGNYIGDFWGSLPSTDHAWAYFNDNGEPNAIREGAFEPIPYDQNINKPFDGMYTCPVVASIGAPLKCFWIPGQYDNPTDPLFNPTFFPANTVEQCGSNSSILFIFNSPTTFFDNAWPYGSLAGNSFPEPETIRWLGNVVIGDLVASPGIDINPAFANTITLYPYTNWYTEGVSCTYFSELYREPILDENGDHARDPETDEELWNITFEEFQIPNIPRSIGGYPGCIGIIKWNINSNNELTNAVFYPVQQSVYGGNMVDRLDSPGNAALGDLDLYYFWTEAHIPVAHNYLPAWANKQVYW